ncbi:MAG TPA: RsmB/NOP family class I SAM-dependent RNA methyltransferase [Kofleriaceae bacterium]|nr:RsmB/NOP family class I SAM-dependent RNA methyltransferase [Kofleriaceae bacterium]
MVRQLRRVDAAVSRGGRRGAPRDTDRLLAYLLLEGLITAADAARVEPSIDWRAAATIDEHIARERDPARRIALGCSLPDWLAARFVADWGDRAESLARSLGERAPMTVRANRLKTTREELAKAFAGHGLATTPGRYADDALVVDTRTNLFALPELKDGLFEMQDEGSQLLAALVAPARETVVDLCAGAGGKTLALAAMMGNKGRIVACDIDEKKLEELRRRGRRAGVTTVDTIHLPDGVWPDALEDRRDAVARVLVDAPCSGVGALRRNPEARWRMAEADIADFAKRQRAIADHAATLLAPGGTMVYATCTLLAAENQAVAEAVADARGLAIVAPSEVLGERAAELTTADGRWFTVAPDRHGTDGFFAAILRRPAAA